ncbi:MAG: hypothetical protein MJZ38_00195, partial [archaeon]|nr:hypothetical protein [archaeon]
MFNKYDEVRNRCMLTGKYKKQGYDWWWHSLTAVNDATGEERPFFFEYYGCNPGISPDECVFGQAGESKAKGERLVVFRLILARAAEEVGEGRERGDDREDDRELLEGRGIPVRDRDEDLGDDGDGDESKVENGKNE